MLSSKRGSDPRIPQGAARANAETLVSYQKIPKRFPLRGIPRGSASMAYRHYSSFTEALQ